MSLQPEPVGPVPEETARVARAAFPKGTRYMRMRDVLGAIYADADFAALFPARGRPAAAPWRLALVTVMQFAEGLSDRQAAEAVRARIDWKYALGLDLTDPGFDFSVLCEFRGRLVAGDAAHLVLDRLLAACTARGLLAARGRQRTDSTHVLGALRALSRLERVAETLRVALEALARTDPGWVRAHAPAAWYARYGRRIEEYRLPRSQADRAAFAAEVGTDGMALLAALGADGTPAELREVPEVAVLRQVWDHQYAPAGDGVRFRATEEVPAAADQTETPHEPEARFAVKRGTAWTGYKAHLTETCDDDTPHLITHVETTLATDADLDGLDPIQADLARKALLPGRHPVDAGYVRGSTLVASGARGVDLVGPIQADSRWQATEATGFAAARFAVDWEAHVVTCPRGKASAHWGESATARGPLIEVRFAPADCAARPVRARCTRAKTAPRGLTLAPREVHEAIRAARARQETPAFAAEYAGRAGVEGTLSQGVRAFGLRRARYRGLAKAHLQHLATAAGINLARLHDWRAGRPRSQTRRSRFARLAPAA